MSEIMGTRESDVCSVRLNPETLEWDPKEPLSKMYIFGTVFEISKLSDGKLHGTEIRHCGTEPIRIPLDLTDNDLMEYIFKKLGRKEPK